ncbi:MAG: rod-binding protein [Deltaproteobacteria bacterium]|nr:rod-binding protein [Deltaproteobacteria bacterium]
MRADIYPVVSGKSNDSKLMNLKGRAGAALEKTRMREAAQEFESLMIEQMIREMRKNVPKSDLFGNSKGQEIFEEMLDGEYAKNMVDKGGIGLADMLVRQFDPPQGIKNGRPR